jgi:hypothetical protein
MEYDQKNINELNQSLKKAESDNLWNKIKRWIPSVIILPIVVIWIVNRGEYGLLDNIDLVIHEAGHFFFSFFGKFIYTLGGTLMQIILPSIIALFFFRNNYRTGVQFGLLWLGQNFINISVYAADARSRKIPLLGGNKVYHDWHYLLGEIGILEFDQEVGYVLVGIAILIFTVAVLMPLLTHD